VQNSSDTYTPSSTQLPTKTNLNPIKTTRTKKPTLTNNTKTPQCKIKKFNNEPAEAEETAVEQEEQEPEDIEMQDEHEEPADSDIEMQEDEDQ
jgi:hypothetical protein